MTVNNKNNRLKPEPVEECKTLNIDELIKLISVLLVSIGIVIYCYALGYFEKVGIPGYPSFKGSIFFFFKNLAGFSYAKWASNLGLILLFISLIAPLFVSDIKQLKSTNRKIFVGVLVFIALLGMYLAPVAAPVFLMILLSGLLLKLILHNNKYSSNSLIQNYLSYFILLCVCSVWSFGNFSTKPLIKSDNMSSYFSRGTVLSVSTTSSWLLWSDENVYYWAHCDKMRGYIYGTNDMEKVIVKLQMGDDVTPLFCQFDE